MSKIDYQKLREIAEKTKIAGETPVMPFDQRINALNDFMKHFSPDIALALLDELERNQQYIKHRDQENEDIALTVGKLRVELEAAKKRIVELKAEPVSQTYKLNQISGNSPVTPDGWISCSERMPEIRQTVIGWNGYAVRQCVYTRNEYAKTQKGREPRFETLTGIWHGVTHWMPLPEPPQEVNRG
ncbi:DUF551 domain-containing protein [Escherichia coli]|nr:DUF551 domain-containing protein [Escherichia coli]EFO4371300.1 DUF551 domain-containing protein [Escherichia coli]